MTTGVETLREKVARAIAKGDGLIFDEVCGYESADDECDSSTCIAACYEDHDPEWARTIYLRQADAALAAMPDQSARIAELEAEFASLRAAAEKMAEAAKGVVEEAERMESYGEGCVDVEALRTALTAYEATRDQA